MTLCLLARESSSCFNGTHHRKAGNKPIRHVTLTLRSEVAYSPLSKKGCSDPLHGPDKGNPLRFHTGKPAGLE